MLTNHGITRVIMGCECPRTARCSLYGVTGYMGDDFIEFP